LIVSFKLSFRFLQDKVLHDLSRILPEMNLFRFDAVRRQTNLVAVDILIFMSQPFSTLPVATRLDTTCCLGNEMYQQYEPAAA